MTSINAGAVDVDSCLEIARTGMIAGAQKDVCGFKGDLKERLKDLYRANNCGKLVSTSELNNASEEVLTGMRADYVQSGENAFCNEAKKYYYKEYEDFYNTKKNSIDGKEQQQATSRRTSEYILYMAIFDENFRPTNTYKNKDECEENGKKSVAHFKEEFIKKGEHQIAKNVKYQCESIFK